MVIIKVVLFDKRVFKNSSFNKLPINCGKIEYLGKSLKILILQDIDHNMRVDKIMKFLELN